MFLILVKILITIAITRNGITQKTTIYSNDILYNIIVIMMALIIIETIILVVILAIQRVL